MSDEKPNIETRFADMLRGADLLSVAADFCEEKRADKVMRIAAEAAGDAYLHVGESLAREDHDENAREAFVKAHSHYIRAGLSPQHYKARNAIDGSNRTYPRDGNGYW